MESSNNGKNPCSLHPLHRRRRRHHHHLFYVSPQCPLHRSIIQPHNHSPNCSFSNPTSHHQPEHPYLSFSDLQLPDDDTKMMQNEVVKPVEEEEDEEPVFVLTDEWREFFAKSEAKRRLAKKEAKKTGKI